MEEQRRRDRVSYVLSLVPEGQDRTPEEPAAALGRFVRARREGLGLTQEEASRIAEVSKTTWQQIEWGEGGGARNLTLHAMASPLQVDVAVLLDLRDGNIDHADARMFSRSRAEVLDSIARSCEALRVDDLYAIEEYVLTRAELRRLQRSGHDREPAPRPPGRPYATRRSAG